MRILARIALGIFLFLFCFVGGTKIYGAYCEAQLRKNIKLVKIGMSQSEVIRILGQPSQRVMSDIPGSYWCYDTDYLGRLLDENPDNRMGQIILEMGKDDLVVVKVFDLK